MSENKDAVKVWLPKYPITNMPHNVWNTPEYCLDNNRLNALAEANTILDKIDEWHTGLVSDLVALYDWTEKECKEVNGEIPVKGAYVFLELQIELILGCKVNKARQFLEEMGLRK